jgi:hypothetical protein
MNKKKEMRNLSLVRKWFLFLLIAPGVFLIIWFYMQSGQNKTPDTGSIPQNFIDGGMETSFHDVIVRAGDSQLAITSDSIKLPLNNITVEPAFILMAVPVYISKPEYKIRWLLIDEKGRTYNPLPVEQSAIKELITSKVELKSVPQQYLLFKPKRGEKYYYLVANIKDKKINWRFTLNP